MLPQLDPVVQFYCHQGIAPSTHKTYQSALRRCAAFCSSFSILSPFAVSEGIVCYFSAFLASQQLAPQTIKTYLSAIRFMQITLGLPEPREFSSLPRLRLVQAGIQRVYSQHQPAASKIRLPITPSILSRIHHFWSSSAADPETIMLWAAACTCFFGFFRAGELMAPSSLGFNPSAHLC